jgi:hypothetical protein
MKLVPSRFQELDYAPIKQGSYDMFLKSTLKKILVFYVIKHMIKGPK